MASLGSSIRSAARATSSAYRRLPIRWRLAGGSAALTLVILLGFAFIVGVLTTRRIQADFDDQVASAADALAQKVVLAYDPDAPLDIDVRSKIRLRDYAAPQSAAIRIVFDGGQPVISRAPRDAAYLGPPLAPTVEINGYRVENRRLPIEGVGGFAYLQYARKKSDVTATARRVRVFLGLGVVGGAALALLAGLSTSRRAMSPITELSDAARRITRTRDPSLELPRFEADDEVSELALTLEGMLASLDEARGETEAALSRQREFVADASHELRTPLTSVLANLELLEEELEGEQREAAASALRSSRRMRRLVADLLLLARADAGRVAPHEVIDLSEIVTEAAGELEPVAGKHRMSVSAAPGAYISGARDELHRLVLNLLENGLRHTDPGTAVEAMVERRDGDVILAVEDDGPGIPVALREKVFERFYRGEADRGGSSGLGLAIVRAVASSHAGNVRLVEPLDGRGARFVVRFPAAGERSPTPRPRQGAPSAAA